MPVSIYPLKKVFCWYNVFLLPSLTEFRSNHLKVVLKYDLIFLIFKKKPDKNKFLIKVLGWFEYFNFCSLFSFKVFHVKNIGNKSIGNLPWGVYFNEVGNVIID